LETWRIHAEMFRLLVLCGILVGAAYSDLKDSRIPNSLSLGAILAGFLLGFIVSGVAGLSSSAYGMLAGGGPLLLIYMVGLTGAKPLMGAGDVKLMAGVGAFAGPWGALWSVYYALWIAGVIALCVVGYCMLRRREIPKTLPFGACLAFGTTAALVFRVGAFSGLVGGIAV